MTWIIQTNDLGYPRITDIDTTARVQVGTIVQARHFLYGVGEFIYLSGVASTATGSWVTYFMDNGATVLLAPNAIGPVAVAMGPTVANTFGWYQISGKAIGLALAGYVDNALVYATATAGSVDDAVVAGDRVKNALGASALGVPSGSFAEFEIQRPFMDDGSAA